jgi:hypothetical protein
MAFLRTSRWRAQLGVDTDVEVVPFVEFREFRIFQIDYLRTPFAWSHAKSTTSVRRRRDSVLVAMGEASPVACAFHSSPFEVNLFFAIAESELLNALVFNEPTRKLSTKFTSQLRRVGASIYCPHGSKPFCPNQLRAGRQAGTVTAGRKTRITTHNFLVQLASTGNAGPRERRR